MTLNFCDLLDRCDLKLHEIASEFSVPLDAVIQWESGEILPPDRILRSLAIMADFSAKPSAISHQNAVPVSPAVSPGIERQAKRERQSQLGQFMTPPSIAEFMASMFMPPSDKPIRLLDAGAGRGALTVAFLQHTRNVPQLRATAFEIDERILPELRASLSAVSGQNNVTVEVIKNDFIEEAATGICLGKGARYTHAILNPPYKKISNDSKHRGLLRSAGLETVNLYSGFVGLALQLLETNGELVTIIPRSFCNGPYYQPFRNYILRLAAIQHIHLFESRHTAFKDDGVLQENIIIKLVRGGEQQDVTVSTSTDDSFADYTEKQHDFSRIVFDGDINQFIHIPTGDDIQLLERAGFDHSLADLGLTVSTGPVVDFRMRDDLYDDPQCGTVPLLYPGHFGPAGLEWPKPGFKKSNAIGCTEKTRKWLYPNGFYAVVRRFSSKEERRRIVANVIDPALLPAEMIGIENHLNVFHSNRGPILEDLAHGLAAYLNATAVDTYFRRFNGHTQVNATDLRAMRYPSLSALKRLGQWAKSSDQLAQGEIDEKVNLI